MEMYRNIKWNDQIEEFFKKQRDSIKNVTNIGSKGQANSIGCSSFHQRFFDIKTIYDDINF